MIIILSFSIVLINLKFQNLNITIEEGDLQLFVDVELISKAFNEIIKNSIYYSDNDFSKVSINVFSKESNSPFLKPVLGITISLKLFIIFFHSFHFVKFSI